MITEEWKVKIAQGYQPNECDDCLGQGVVDASLQEIPEDAVVVDDRTIECPRCGGTGQKSFYDKLADRLADLYTPEEVDRIVQWFADIGPERLLEMCRRRVAEMEAEEASRRVDYREYIRSDAWRIKANEAKARAGYRCEVCNSTEKIQAHHRTYERLGHEEPGDITVLCDTCHELFSKNGRLKR